MKTKDRMQVFKSVDDWRDYRKGLTGSVGFVPTMGALHAGHGSLIERSVANRQGWMQFGAGFLLVALCVPWGNLSAMFDRREIPEPGAFRTDRPWETYIHWGYGMHTCFGDAIGWHS